MLSLCFLAATTTFELAWKAQVPKQIRRSGRDNKEGIDFTMTQWYPKLAEYDEDGWHPDQYVGREFYGVWGNFDVTIDAHRDYLIGGTGVLQNPDEVGFGYGGVEKVRVRKNKKRRWHFKAERVHDFAFAADPDYVHQQIDIQNGPVVHLLFDPETANAANWELLKTDYLQRYFDFMAAHFGRYPYPQFSIIQGGDGGMEYPMCTMILGGGDKFEGFTGLFVHEATHNWYYGVLATNEAAHPWMDEGFTSYAEEECMNVLFEHNAENPHLGAYRKLCLPRYFRFERTAKHPCGPLQLQYGLWHQQLQRGCFVLESARIHHWRRGFCPWYEALLERLAIQAPNAL